MSLKVRLTILYTSIVGGIFIFLSATIYSLVTVTLVSQLDEQLENTWNTLRLVTRVNEQGELENSREVVLDSNVIVQAWGRDGTQKETAFSALQLAQALNPEQLNTASPNFSDNFVDSVHFRVLSVPLVVGDRGFGTLQIGAEMSLVDRTQEDLLVVLTISVVIAIVLAAAIGWVTIESALQPLERTREAALQITQSNDLSRRIPSPGRSRDEVSQIVDAFNQNISRLERLIETQRRFVADVGHELRTPLTVIKGNVGLMRQMKTFDEESLVGISEEVDRLTRLVGDLILLAQAEAGKLPLIQEEVELDTLLLDVFHQMTVLAREKQVQLTLGEVDQILVCGDRDRLTQVMVNLISNGIKYTPAKDRVVVNAAKTDDTAWFSIQDNGPGIPQDDLPHIFERFFRAEKSRHRTQDGKGFGLGLSIAYWIVMGHNGRIEVDSQEGVGTVFTVYLPLKSGTCESEKSIA